MWPYKNSAVILLAMQALQIEHSTCFTRAFQRKRLVTKNAINGGVFYCAQNHLMDLRGWDKTAHRKKSQCRDYTSCLAVYTVAL